MFFVILLGLAIPLPLAIYFSILYALNRQPHPVMVSGATDFALALFASSGFVIFGGPFVLAGFHDRARYFLLFGPLRGTSSYDWRLWITVWIGYGVVAIAVSAFLLARRRRATCIYNIDLALFQQLLGETLDRLRLDWLRDADLVSISASEPRPETLAADNPRAHVEPGKHPPATVVRVDAFPSMRHVTLYWPGGSEHLRREVESELAQTLESAASGINPAAAWMFSIAGSLYALMFFTAAAVVMFLYFLTQAPQQ